MALMGGAAGGPAVPPVADPEATYAQQLTQLQVGPWHAAAVC